MRIELQKEIELLKPAVVITLGDKEVYQRLRKTYDLQIKSKFEDAAYNPQEITIGKHTSFLVAACHPDISYINNRKPEPSKKWAAIHSNKFVATVKRILDQTLIKSSNAEISSAQ